MLVNSKTGEANVAICITQYNNSLAIERCTCSCT